MVTCSRGFYLGCLVLWTHLNERIGMPANDRSVWCQHWYSHFIALLPVPCECPKPPQALEQHCRGCGELNELSCAAALPSPAAQPMVTDFYPSRPHPLRWPVYSFSYLVIFWGTAQIISSYHYFTFLGIASWRILKDLLRELTRITVLSLHRRNRFLLFPLWTLFPDITPGEAESVLLRSLCPCTRGNAWLWTIIAQVSLFLWAKIFPEWRRETRMIDGLEPSLISSLADSLVMYAPGWCADRWQLIDSPGLGYREDETCLEHLTRCLCGAPEHCRLNPLWMQARYARLGRWLSVPELKAEVFFPSMTDREQTSLHFW